MKLTLKDKQYIVDVLKSQDPVRKDLIAKFKQATKAPKPKKPGLCEVCNCELGIPGGFAHSDMCGPCSTGESETLSDKFTDW